jgi:hypothetical protein
MLALVVLLYTAIEAQTDASETVPDIRNLVPGEKYYIEFDSSVGQSWKTVSSIAYNAPESVTDMTSNNTHNSTVGVGVNGDLEFVVNGVPVGTWDSTDALQLKPHGVESGQTGSISFLSLKASGTDFVRLRAPDNLTQSTNYTLPAQDGLPRYRLLTDGSGNMFWDPPAVPQPTSLIADGTTSMVCNASGSAIISSNSTQIAVFDDTNGLLLKPTGATPGDTGQVSFAELAVHGTNKVSLKAPDSVTADYVLRLPSASGGVNDRLKTDGTSGNLEWAPHNFYETVTVWSMFHASYLSGSTTYLPVTSVNVVPAQCTITETRIEDSVTQVYFCVHQLSATYIGSLAGAMFMVGVPIDSATFSTIFSGNALWSLTGPGWERAESVGTWAAQEPDPPYRSQEGRLFPIVVNSDSMMVFVTAADATFSTKTPLNLNQIMPMGIVNSRLRIRFTIKLS